MASCLWWVYNFKREKCIPCQAGPLTCLTGKNKEKALWIWRRHFSIFHLLRWKCIKKKKWPPHPRYSNCGASFPFSCLSCKLCKSDSFEGQSKETSKVATLSTTFFLTKKSYISLLLCSAMNCDEKVLFLCFAHASSSSKILEVTCTEMNLERL